MTEKASKAVELAMQNKKTIDDHMLEQTRQLINNSYEGLIANTENSKLPEDIFRNVFLPYFTGQQTENIENVTTQWVGIAGSAMSKVDIIDTQGNVLFTVPELMNTSGLDVIKRRAGDSLEDRTSTYHSHALTSPALARNYLQQGLDGKLNQMVSVEKAKGAFKDRSNEWNKVFSYYGLNGPDTENSSSGKENPSFNNSDPETDVVYD
jgi:hypothetical protein